MIEKFAKELGDKEYKILQKLLEGKPIEQKEFELINTIGFGDFKVAVEDADGTVGLTLLWYAVLVRNKRGQGNIRIT